MDDTMKTENSTLYKKVDRSMVLEQIFTTLTILLANRSFCQPLIRAQHERYRVCRNSIRVNMHTLSPLRVERVKKIVLFTKKILVLQI